MESVSSDTNTSVSSSPDFMVEPSNSKKFETSVSVSSLAEKFEKSGDFSKCEEKSSTEGASSTESVMERSDPLPENKSVVSEINGCTSQTTVKAKGEVICYKEQNGSSENSEYSVTRQAAIVENSTKDKMQSVEVSSDPCKSVKEVKNETNSNISQPLKSADDVQNLNLVSPDCLELSTDLQTATTIAERVNFYVNTITNTSQNSVSDSILTKSVPDNVPREVSQVSSSEPKQNVEGTVRNVSLNDLQQVFIQALHMVNREDGDTLPVPSIQITEASDREDNSSDDAEDLKPKSEVGKTEVQTPVEKEDTRQINEQSSTSIASQVEGKDQSEASAEERKAVFYISSSDLPAEPPHESEENCNESRQSSENVEGRADSVITEESNETRSSCLRSKTCQGITFLVSFVISISGCILYSFAHDGKAPDYCEHLGLVIAIVAGIVGAFSCFCYSCLDVTSGPSRSGYELIPDAGYFIPSLPPQNEAVNAQARNIDNSWSSERERAFRRQNGMSSTRTSAASLKSELGEYLAIKKSEHRELVDKTENLKNGILEILDSFNAFMSKLQPIDKLVEMESGTMNG